MHCAENLGNRNKLARSGESCHYDKSRFLEPVIRSLRAIKAHPMRSRAALTHAAARDYQAVILGAVNCRKFTYAACPWRRHTCSLKNISKMGMVSLSFLTFDTSLPLLWHFLTLTRPYSDTLTTSPCSDAQASKDSRLSSESSLCTLCPYHASPLL